MTDTIKVKSALISVYHKESIEDWVKELQKWGVVIYSTGGTYDYIRNMGIDAISVEKVTDYPSIFGGRVKTLHPQIMGGILYRRNVAHDQEEAHLYNIPSIDLVIVDLYPFAQTIATTDIEEEITEKIDIGGISLIRAAAKNFAHVAIVPASNDFDVALQWFREEKGGFSLDQRKYLAARAFAVSSEYDSTIFNYFSRQTGAPGLRISLDHPTVLRYGENPHQKGWFYGNSEEIFSQLHGKEISYNNFLDIDAALELIEEFEEPTVAIIKHNNACGCASADSVNEAWEKALAGDPVSAFGGVIVSNEMIDEITASLINELFFEIIIAPGYEKKALEILKSRKNRIILQLRSWRPHGQLIRSALGGLLVQDRDPVGEDASAWEVKTLKAPSAEETDDLVFANKVVKHLKSNAIALAKNRQLIGAGAGQTSRVDALKQAIEKARGFGFSLQGAVLASDAFFPFADSVQLAHESGITAIVQPGGSIRDQDSIDFCNQNGVAMLFTGVRHFKH
ncbi:MAG: bifunctional phosphoribosylaminoimidazolecarboxamide formyltransferase/IMP cyclohydrolase [Bacteroidales bacterium]